MRPLTSLLLIVSGCAPALTLAGAIDAGSFVQGTDISNIDPSMTLSMETHVWDSPDVTISPVIVGTTCGVVLGRGPCGNDLGTYTGNLVALRNGIIPPDPPGFSALRIDFNSPVYVISATEVNDSGDGLTMYVYDTQGNLIANPVFPYSTASALEPYTFTFNGTFSSSVQIGSVLIGSESAASYITDIDAEPVAVPEPSTLAVLAAGLVCIAWRRGRLRRAMRAPARRQGRYQGSDRR